MVHKLSKRLDFLYKAVVAINLVAIGAVIVDTAYTIAFNEEVENMTKLNDILNKR